MTSLETLDGWLGATSENEHLEFKAANQQIDRTKLLRYCCALSNEGGGSIVLGVTDKQPRHVVGTQAFSSTDSLHRIKKRIKDKLGFRVDVSELKHPNGRVLVFDVPGRALGMPIPFEGEYLMRCGDSLTSMTPDVLKEIFAEDTELWFTESAMSNAGPDKVIALLDTQIYFDLIRRPYPTNRDAVLKRLASEDLIHRTKSGWNITNLAAILLAKRLEEFGRSLARKAPRFVIYEGKNKLMTRDEVPGAKGYAVGFEGLVDFVHASAPQNRFVEEAVRREVKMFPRQALRELIANALVHQDFNETGTSVMIEMYDDRIEVSSPGSPQISVDRFIDEYKSRNEQLADLMRRMGICEEKGSGIDKVVHEAEFYQLPAPEFRAGNARTTAVLFAHQAFSDMSKPDRIRACYQHCVLQYLSNQKMSNQSLRKRFGLDDSASCSATTSQVIAATKEANLIKPDERRASSTRYARYLPWWA